MAHHEFWRDEVRALSIAIKSKGYLGLPAALKDEGHPLGWYVLLKFLWQIFHQTWVLPALSLAFATGIAWLMLFRSPFPLWLSALLIFGSFGLYEYGINCRNYGIAGFLFLLFAHVRSRYPTRLLLQCLLLALATQCNVYAAMIACILTAWMLWEAALAGKSEILRALLPAALVAASFLLTVWVTLPSDKSLVIGHNYRNPDALLNIWQPGRGFHDLLNLPLENDIMITSFALWISLLLFLPRPRSILILFLGLLAVAGFGLYFRPNFLQHQGMWVYMYLALAWIHWPAIAAGLREKTTRGLLSGAGIAVFSLILIAQLFHCYTDYRKDLRESKSESGKLALWLKEQRVKTTDILMAEPDYILESLMYYRNGPYWLPRERTFGWNSHFTKDNAQKLTLIQMLDDADTFQMTQTKTWIILNRHYRQPGSFRFSYDKEFKVDPSGLARLQRDYILRDSFVKNWWNEEVYFIYEPK